MSDVQKTPVKSADRALAILEALSEFPGAPTFNELQAVLKFPRASLHVLLTTLRQRGWLERDPQTRRYTWGPLALHTAAEIIDCSASPPTGSEVRSGPVGGPS